MNRIIRYSLVVLLGLICSSAFADDKTDELTWEGLGLSPSATSYAPFSDKTFTSTAVYAGTATSGAGKYIQLRSNKSDAGIVTTKSGGKLKSVTIAFNESTTDRGIDIYGKNEPYTEGPDMYKDAKGELIGTIYANDASMTLTTENNYKYVGMVAHNGAIYIDKITVVWTEEEGGETKTTTKVEFSGDFLTRFTPGKDGDETLLPVATVMADDAVVEGAEAKWTLEMGSNWIMGEEEPSIYDGKVYIPNHSSGDIKLTAKYAGDDTYESSSKSYTLKVYKGFMNIQSILEDFPVVGGDSWKAKEAEWNKGYQASYWQVDDLTDGDFQSKEALVTFASGSYTYIKDDYGTLLLYGSGLGFKQGDVISGDLGNDQGFGGIFGTLKTYNGLLELAVTKNDVEFVVKSSDNPVEPKTITLDELNQTNMNEYVKIESAVFVSANNKNLTFKVGETEFAVYNQWNVDVTALEAGAEYNLTGMGSVYYRDETVTNQLYLVSFEKNHSGAKKETTVEFSNDYLTRFTPGKDGDETLLPTATVMAEEAAVEGAAVAWTLEMGDNWVMGEEEPSIYEGKVYIPNHSCGDLTLTAKFEGNDSYEPSSKSYTLKVYKGYMNIQSILEDFPEIGGDTWKEKEAKWNKGEQVSFWEIDMSEEGVIRGKEALVTYANGQYTYIKDDFGSLLLYGNNLGFKQGDKITSSVSYLTVYPPILGGIYGTLKTYNGLLELAVNKEDVEFIVASSDNAVEPKTITIDELNQSNMNEYLRIERAEFVSADKKNLTFKVGETEFAVYNQWNLDVTALTAGTEYILNGMGSVYYKNETVTNQLYLVSFEEDNSTSISLTPGLYEGEGAVYDLSGRIVNSQLDKGIYIVNGKKILK